MTLRDVAEQLDNIPLEHVEVTLRFKTNVMPEDDANALELSRELRIAKISREIKLIGDLDEQQRKTLMEEAAQCPVHNTLSHSIRIDDAELEAG